LFFRKKETEMISLRHGRSGNSTAVRTVVEMGGVVGLRGRLAAERR
jgi:hypothetical protein